MKRLKEIIWELEQIQEKESTRLFRLARKAAAHGCSDRLCGLIRNEGWTVKRMNPEDLLNPFTLWIWAFK